MGLTNTITAGEGQHETVLVYRGAKKEYCDSERLRVMLNLAQRLETLCNSTALDIEFALSHTGQLYLLQVRPIVNARKWKNDNTQVSVKARFSHIESYINAFMSRREGLYGDKTIFGNMPDWNPAEIIGSFPTPLASSLYRRLVTSRVWQLAREEMGYRRFPKTELMCMISGTPYIDVRASFNSFLPEGVDDEVGEKLVNAWIERLDTHPELHDKVEFDIVPTVCDFEFEKTFQERYPDLLTQEELGEFALLLQKLTDRLVDVSKAGSLEVALNDIETLRQRQEKARPILVTACDYASISQAAWIDATLEDCIHLGTRPFSILARHGFIAETLLRSLVNVSAISSKRVSQFKSSFPTILGEMALDLYRLSTNESSIDEFMDKFGHLRPGTYDIQAQPYHERKDAFLKQDSIPVAPSYSEFILRPDERDRVSQVLKAASITRVDADGFFDYARKAIAGREYAKFIFTRSLSRVLDLIGVWGSRFGLNREELSFLQIDHILQTTFISFHDDEKQRLLHFINEARTEQSANNLLKMGYLIRDIKDLHVVPIHRSSPNFITANRIEAPVVHLSARSSVETDLDGKIVCVENADPGFDWVFSKNIAGLISKFGGANSHMAIRCSEMDLPAAIGCGEVLFASLKSGTVVMLSCKEKLILPLQTGS